MGFRESMADLYLRGSQQEAANVQGLWQGIGAIAPQTVGAMQDLAQRDQQMKYYETVRQRQQQELDEKRLARFQLIWKKG
jgi:hypothetical protein